jgi:hypothetical protein
MDLFHFLKHRKKGGAVSLRIVDKLRQDIPEGYENREGHSSKQLFELLHKDNVIRKKVSEQDFYLLKHSLTTVLIKAIIVYIIALLVVTSIVAYVYHSNKPESLKIENFQLFSTDSY